MPPLAADHLVDIDDVERLPRVALEAHAKALRTINAIVDVVLSAADPRDALGPAVESILRFTRFPAVALFALNEAAQRLEALYMCGFSEATKRVGWCLPLAGSATGVAVQRREILLIPDVAGDPSVEPAVRERLVAEGFSAAALVPLLVGDRAVGAMNLIYKGALGLTECEQHMLASIGRAMAMALDRASFVRAIEHERQRFEATLCSIGDAVLATDEQGRVTFMNPEAERLTAWTQDEALNRSVDEIFRIQDARTRETLESPVTRGLHQREVVRLQADAVLVSRDGSERNVSDTSAPILDVRGKAWGAVLAFQDVTQTHHDRDWLAFMHQASLLLTQSLDYETTLRQVARLAVVSLADASRVDILEPDGSIRCLAGAHADPAKQPLIDAVLRFSHLDPGAPAGTPKAIRTRQPVVYGFSREEGPLPDPLDVDGSYDPEFVRALRALELSSALFVPLVAGETTLGALVLGSRSPHRFQQSDVDRAQQLAHCFSLHIETARLHRDVRDALATREEFLNLASHELKTPLTSLQLDLQALARRAGGDPALAAKAVRALRQAERLERLSQTLVDVSVLSAGGILPNLREVDLRAVVADAAARWGEEAARARCAIDFRAGPPVIVRCDEARIEQAVCNLIANAIKFGRGFGIELSVDSKDEAMARIAVTDHGIGVAPKDRARIFERFERAVPSQHYGGLGLGLYVAREVVRAHAGSILVAGAPGAGSTFTILLPKQLERDAHAAHA